ncbi:RCC1 domain-containing protein [Actinophytocola sediminis]
MTPSAATFVTVFPGGVARPDTSSLNLVTGEIRANQVTVALGTNQTVSLYNNAGNTHLLADLAGYYHTGVGAKFTALPASRLTDTRWDGVPVGAGGTVDVDFADRIPASATAVTFNLTVTDVTAATFVTAWPTGAPRPNASNVNVTSGETRPNLVTIALGLNRKVSLYNHTGSVHVTADLTGFYTPDYGASFLPLPPTRVLDTRNGTGGTTRPVGPGAEIEVDLGSGIPVTTTGLVLNLTGLNATASTYVTAWGPFRYKPNASTLNIAPGQITPNAAVVALAQLPAMKLYNHRGNVHLLGDLTGVFAVTDAPCTADCVHAWGDINMDRTLGTAELGFGAPTPTPVAALSGIRAVVGGGDTNGYALRTDGTVWTWGNNGSGRLGNGWTTYQGSYGGGSVVPVPVLGLTNVTAIAGDSWGAYALRSDGTVWAWGSGGQGRLGNGQTRDAAVPVQVTGLTDVIAIANSWGNGYALRQNGTVMAWGYNGAGQLGDGTDVEQTTVPVQVPLTEVTAIASGGNGAYAVRTDGTVWAWGTNDSGQLGNGQPCDTSACMSRVPVQVSGLVGVHALTASMNNTYALHEDGSVWAWGRSHNGQLGNGVECDPTTTTCESRVPVQVSGLTDITQIGNFTYGGYALRADGTVWAWGNRSDALGNNETSDHATEPVRVLGLPTANAIAGGWNTGYAVVPTP